METQDLINYIVQSRQQRMSDEQIKQNLLGCGWSESDINQALNPSKKGMAILMYFGIGILISLFTGDWRDPFVKFHLKQVIILYVVSIGLDVVFSISEFVVSKGDVKTSLVYLSIGLFVYLAIFTVGIRGITNAASGKMNKLPMIGGLVKYLKF